MNWVRRSIVFGLGLVLVLDSVFGTFKFLEFLLGLVMVGLVPVDAIIDAVMGNPKDEAEMARLEEVMKRKDDPDGKGGT